MLRHMALVAIAGTALIFATESQAQQKSKTPGLAVGAKAPDVRLPDQANRSTRLSELLKKGPVALVFYRSADW